MLVVSVNIFRNIFFNLDKQHPVSPEKLLMLAEFLFFPISLNPLCPRVHPCECGCIHGDPLYSIQPGGFNFSADGAPVDAWPFFPGSK
jgi:hypothetical protein